MARNDRLRGELEEQDLPRDRRTRQVKGDIDVSDLDAEDLGKLRDEDISNLNENELSQLDAQLGVAQGTEEGAEILPVKKLDRDLRKAERERAGDED